MPKGDRLKLKADPEDGTTPIANLLLEAVAMAKISGLQTRAIIHLWRETYGWVDEDGKRKKEAKIPLSEWSRALDSNSSRLSHALGELEGMNIIHRRIADAWGGYYYSLNTEISKWNSNSINLSKLAERASIADFGTIADIDTIADLSIPPQLDNTCDNDNSPPKQQATVDQNARQQLTKTQYPSIYKEILNKDIKKEGQTKSKVTFDEYIVELKHEFGDLDVGKELSKFKLWWSEGNKVLKRPKSAFRNWLDKAREIKNKIEQTQDKVKPSKFGDGWR